MRAANLLELNRPAEAERHVANVLASDPTNRWALALLAKRFRDQERHEEAADAALRLLATYPDDVDGLRLLAASRHDQGRDQEAEPLARRAVQLAPEDQRCLLTLGSILAGLPGRQQEALAAIDKVIELSPGDWVGYFTRAGLLAMQERWADSEEAALAALAVDPANAHARFLLGLARAVGGRFRFDADEDLEQAANHITAALRSMHPDQQQLQHIVRFVEALGIPDRLAPLYRSALSVLGLPDLSRPRPAGDDPARLAEQAKLAATMLDASRRYPGAKDALARATELADAILALEPDNQLARSVRTQAQQQENSPLSLAKLAHDLVVNDRWAQAQPVLAQLAPLASQVPGECLNIFAAAHEHVAGALLAAITEGEPTDGAVVFDPQHVIRWAERALEITPLIPGVYHVDGRTFTRAEHLQGLTQVLQMILNMASSPPGEDHPLVKVIRRAQALANASNEATT